MAGMTLVVVDCCSSPSCEDFSGYKKMRMESPVSKLQRKTPLKQRRSYFDSADYFLEVQGGNPQKPAAAVDPKPPSSTVSTAAPSTPLQQQQQQVLPMKLQPCKHVSQPSRLSVRT